MQDEILHVFRSSRQNAAKPSGGEGASRALAGTGPEFGLYAVSGVNGKQRPHGGGHRATSASRDIALSFLRLANLDNEIVDRLSRYEAALWRHLARRCSPCKPSNTGEDRNEWSLPCVMPVPPEMASFGNLRASFPPLIFTKRTQFADHGTVASTKAALLRIEPSVGALPP